MNKITTKNLPGFLNERGVGFDRLFDLIDSYGPSTGYPPYNVISVNEDEYLIEVAIAGFSKDDVTITQDGNDLLVEGTRDVPENADGTESSKGSYLHRGISSRPFTRKFILADHVNVETANIDNGMLTIELKRELPEALKPRTIAIK